MAEREPEFYEIMQKRPTTAKPSSVSRAPSSVQSGQPRTRTQASTQRSPSRASAKALNQSKQPTAQYNPSAAPTQRASARKKSTDAHGTTRNPQMVSAPPKPTKPRTNGQPKTAPLAQNRTRRTQHTKDNTIPYQKKHRKPQHKPTPKTVREAPLSAEEALRIKAFTRKQKRIRTIFSVLLILVLLSVGAFLTVTLLFKVKTIHVQAPDGSVPADTGIYTEDIIISKFDVAIEESLFSFRVAEKEREMHLALPLLETIEIHRSGTSTVNIRVCPAQARYTVQADGCWLVLSESLRVIEERADKPALTVLQGYGVAPCKAGELLSFTELAGVATATPDATNSASPSASPSATTKPQSGSTALETTQEPSSSVIPTSDMRMEMLLSLLHQLQEMGLLEGITGLTFESEEGISFLYENRILVQVGTSNNLDYKLKLVSYILQNEQGDGCAPSDIGTLDVSYQQANGDIEAVFSQGELVTAFLPETIKPEATPEPTAESEEVL